MVIDSFAFLQPEALEAATELRVQGKHPLIANAIRNPGYTAQTNLAPAPAAAKIRQLVDVYGSPIQEPAESESDADAESDAASDVESDAESETMEDHPETEVETIVIDADDQVQFTSD